MTTRFGPYLVGMMTALGLAALGALMPISCSSPRGDSSTAPHPQAFQKGMVFGLFARSDPRHADRGLAELRDLGVDSVMIVIPWVTPDVRSLEMAPRGDMTPSDASLVSTIRKAKTTGMRLFLMPILFVDAMGPGEWRGTLAPPDWDSWFANYDKFILHYARMAESEGVEYFSVGSELCSAEKYRDRWLDLLKKVRSVYKGQLTYSSNWDSRQTMTFADALDVLGLNGYYELSQGAEPAEQELVTSWIKIKKDIEAWRAPTGKDLILTEVGYPSRKGATRDPWNHAPGGVPDLEVQFLCYRVFERVWRGEPRLAGVYFYQWWGAGGAGDPGYTPRGKPAANVVRNWYSESR